MVCNKIIRIKSSISAQEEKSHEHWIWSLVSVGTPLMFSRCLIDRSYQNSCGSLITEEDLTDQHERIYDKSSLCVGKEGHFVVQELEPRNRTFWIGCLGDCLFLLEEFRGNDVGGIFGMAVIVQLQKVTRFVVPHLFGNPLEISQLCVKNF